MIDSAAAPKDEVVDSEVCNAARELPAAQHGANVSTGFDFLACAPNSAML